MCTIVGWHLAGQQQDAAQAAALLRLWRAYCQLLGAAGSSTVHQLSQALCSEAHRSGCATAPDRYQSCPCKVTYTLVMNSICVCQPLLSAVSIGFRICNSLLVAKFAAKPGEQSCMQQCGFALPTLHACAHLASRPSIACTAVIDISCPFVHPLINWLRELG